MIVYAASRVGNIDAEDVLVNTPKDVETIFVGYDAVVWIDIPDDTLSFLKFVKLHGRFIVKEEKIGNYLYLYFMNDYD